MNKLLLGLYGLHAQSFGRLSGNASDQRKFVGIFISQHRPVGIVNRFYGLHDIIPFSKFCFVVNCVPLPQGVQVHKISIGAVKIDVVSGKADIPIPSTGAGEVRDTL